MLTIAGVVMRRKLCGVTPVPSKVRRHQSIANRKQTTERPEKSPINTASTRNKRSSRKAKVMKERRTEAVVCRSDLATELIDQRPHDCWRAKATPDQGLWAGRI